MRMRFAQCLLAALFVGTCTDTEAARPPASPFTGTYAGFVYGDTLSIEISSRGNVSGYFGGWDGADTVSGKMSNEGVLTATVSVTYKRLRSSIQAVGLFTLDESGSLVGVIQFDELEPQEVILYRQ